MLSQNTEEKEKYLKIIEGYDRYGKQKMRTEILISDLEILQKKKQE